MLRGFTILIVVSYALHSAGAALPLAAYGLDQAFGDGCCGSGICLCASTPGGCQCGEAPSRQPTAGSCCSTLKSAYCDADPSSVIGDSCCGEDSSSSSSRFSVPVCGAHKTIGFTGTAPHLSADVAELPASSRPNPVYAERSPLRPLHQSRKIVKIPIAP